MSWATKVIKVLNGYETRRRARRPVDVAWKSALTGEVRFWEKNLRTYKQLSGRLDPRLPLQSEIAELLPAGRGPAQQAGPTAAPSSHARAGCGTLAAAR